MAVGKYVGTDTSVGAFVVALKLGRLVVTEVDDESGARPECVNKALVRVGRSTGDAVGRSGSVDTDTAFAIIASSSFTDDDDRSNRPSIPSTVKAAPATTILPPTTTMAAFVGRTRT